MIPHGLQFIRISFFLIWYNGRYYISIIVQLFATLEAASTDLEYPQLMAIAQEDANQLPALPNGPVPIAYTVF